MRDHYSSSNQKDLPETDFKTHRKKQYLFAIPETHMAPLNSRFGSGGGKLNVSVEAELSKKHIKSQINHSESEDYKLSRFKFRSPLKDSEVEDYNRIKTELKRNITQAKENVSSLNDSRHKRNYLTSIDSIPFEEYNAMEKEYKYEIDRLYFEISRLSETLFELERNKNVEIERIRDQNEKIAFLNITNLKQTHQVQIDQSESQCRKTKQLLQEKTLQYEKLQSKTSRELSHLRQQNTRLGEEMKAILHKKHIQIEALQKKSEESLQAVNRDKEKYANEMKVLWDSELKSLHKKLEEALNQKQLESEKGEQMGGEYERLQMVIETQRIRSKQMMDQLVENEQNKYNKMKAQIVEDVQAEYQSLNSLAQEKDSEYQSEMDRLKYILRLKAQDREKVDELTNERIRALKVELQSIEHQNFQLTAMCKDLRKKSQQQIEITKVKLAVLNEANLKQLVCLYDSKIDQLVLSLEEKYKENNNLRKNLYDETNRRYETKKKTDIQLSKLNAKVILMRSGMSSLQADMKDKIENERSMMVLTSRSIIKEMEGKTSDNKFHEEELRKLRQLFDLQEKEIQESNVQVEEKIKIAQDELNRLTHKILEEKNSHRETESHFKSVLEGKDAEITSLRGELEQTNYPEFDNTKEIELIEQLKQELRDRNSAISETKDRIDFLEKNIVHLKTEIDRYEIQSQISIEEAKRQYQEVSQENLREFKLFFDSKIKELEEEKTDLKELVSNKEEQITELVQKYKQLEEMLKRAISKGKKRTDLEKRIIEMGSDNNLVKNMAEIVKFSSLNGEYGQGSNQE